MPADIVHHGLPALCPQATQAITQLLELSAYPLGIGPAPDHETSFAAAAHIVGEAEETEGPWSLGLSGFAPQGLAAETQYRRLARFDLQVELRQPLRHFREETPRVGFLLETRHVIVGVANQVGFALAAPGETLLEP